MIKKFGVHMINNSTGWFALVNIKKLPITCDDNYEFIYSNRHAIVNFAQLVALRGLFVPIGGYNAHVAVKKIFED